MRAESHALMVRVAVDVVQRESEVPMAETIAAQIAELRQLNLKAARRKFREVFGREAPRWSHRETLFRKIAWELQARKMGGLKEATLAMIEKLARDPAIGIHADMPALPEAKAAPRSETRVFKVGRRLDPRVPLPGTTVSRPYLGKTIAVRVLADGFEFEGTRFRTLSAVAKHVTGQHMSGLRFFGFAPRKNDGATGGKP